MRTGRFLGITAIALLWAACHQQRPVVQRTSEPPPITAPDPARLSEHNVDAVIYLNTSAEARRLYQQCYELARIRLEENLRRPHNLPPAVIVDIDETVLDNSPYQVTAVANGTTFTPGSWSEWTAKASAKALPGSVEFLQWAVNNGCDVFYISNRSEGEKAATITNLRSEGFPTVDEEHVLCMQGRESDKTARRDLVRSKRYIALLVGDQLRDFDEAFKLRIPDHGRPIVDAWADTLSQYFIMLPNPMYGTWLDDVAGKVDTVKLEKKEAFFKTNKY